MREDILTDIPNTDITEIDMGKHAACSLLHLIDGKQTTVPSQHKPTQKIPSKSSYFASEGTVMQLK